MSRKSAQKKRHTKPCRYFQISKCPHSAEVCDFAHVIATPVVPLDRGSNMCRYYVAGRCSNGQTCKYQHGSEETHLMGLDFWSPSQTDATRPSPLYNSYPATYGHVRQSSGFNSSFSCPLVTDSVLFAPPPSRDSNDTASNSISSLDSDEAIVMTNDPQYPEHSHSHQSRVYVEDESPMVHVPPFFPSTHMNMLSPTGVYDYGLSNPVGGGLHTPEPKPRPHPKPMSKQKVLKYKTKPCKFFTTEKGCPNGNACTFVHAEGRDHSNSSSPRPLSPVKYPSLADETDKKTFFPITWRVIGGGVRVGVAKDEFKDHTLSENEDSSGHSRPSNSSNLPPLKVLNRKRSNSIPSTPSDSLFNVGHLFPAESPGVL